MTTLNERILAVRKHKSLKQNEFADLVGVSRSTLSEVESGKTKPSADIFVGIANKFKDINTSWLLTGEGQILKERSSLIQNSVALNNDRLMLAIETVEEGLQATKRTMLPDKKAQLVMAVYDLFSDDQSPAMKQTVLRLVQSANA